MRLIRFILAKLILFFDAVFSPTPLIRSEADQKQINAKLVGLSLYQFEACPFCVKVRRSMRRQGISLPLRDAKTEPFRSELLQNGGKLQVPCLRIEKSEAQTTWLYESDEIISFLAKQISS